MRIRAPEALECPGRSIPCTYHLHLNSTAQLPNTFLEETRGHEKHYDKL